MTVGSATTSHIFTASNGLKIQAELKQNGSAVALTADVWVKMQPSIDALATKYKSAYADGKQVSVIDGKQVAVGGSKAKAANIATRVWTVVQPILSAASKSEAEDDDDGAGATSRADSAAAAAAAAVSADAAVPAASVVEELDDDDALPPGTDVSDGAGLLFTRGAPQSRRGSVVGPPVADSIDGFPRTLAGVQTMLTGWFTPPSTNLP